MLRHSPAAAAALVLLASFARADEGTLDTAGYHSPSGYFAGPEHLNAIPDLFSVSRPAVDGDWAVFAYANLPDWDLTWQIVTPDGQIAPCSVAFPGAFFFPADARFDRTGRLVVAGSVLYEGTTNRRPFVARFLYPNCTLDTEFDGDGYFTYPVADDFDGARVEFLVSGPPLFAEKIVLGGDLIYGGSGDSSDIFFLRLTGSGALDPGFGGGGAWIGDFEDDDNTLSDFLVDTLDRIVLAGTVGSNDPGRDALLVRLLPNGDPDPTFGFSGVRTFHQDSTDRMDYVAGIERAPGGDLYLVGQSISPPTTNRFVMTRLSGVHGFTLDEAVLPSVSGSYLAEALLQGDRRLLLAGNTFSATNSQLFTLAYRVPELALDPSYNDLLDFDPLTRVYLDEADLPHERVRGVALSRQRPLVAGYATDGGQSSEYARPFLARLVNDHIFSDGFEAGTSSTWN